jgi:hypothetical protein
MPARHGRRRSTALKSSNASSVPLEALALAHLLIGDGVRSQRLADFFSIGVAATLSSRNWLDASRS